MGTVTARTPRKRSAKAKELHPPKDPVQAAHAAGLRYVRDDGPGLRRLRKGKGFSYVSAEGKPIRDEKTLERIRSLVLPPAWTDVWICPQADGHVQATGRDAKGRKQHRYHPRWRVVRDETKYGRMIAFGQALPGLREKVETDLKRHGLPRRKVLATVVRLLETTLIRVGNEDYARQNGSFGLTTMRDRHAEFAPGKVRFEFKGKSGVYHSVEIHDRRLARIVKQCQDVPGQELFQYVDDDGSRHTVDSADVNAYLRELSGADFTAKDFRTWYGTVLAAQALQEFEAFTSNTQAKRNLVKAIETVAKKLGNTKAVCRKCYVHPAVLDSYLDGTLADTLRQRVEKKLAHDLHSLPPEEAAVLVLLQQRLKHAAEH